MGEAVQVVTADARGLPFADGGFDAVVSHWVVHNLPTPTDRRAALDEMVRVLRPTGRLLIADLVHNHEYAAALRARGFRVRRVWDHPVPTVLYRLISGGSFAPDALLAERTTLPTHTTCPCPSAAHHRLAAGTPTH